MREVARRVRTDDGDLIGRLFEAAGYPARCPRKYTS
jgi:hypothetical protein